MNDYPMTDQDGEDLLKRFTYHPPKNNQPERYKIIREEAHKLAVGISIMAPKSRELALALTNLEQFVFWANAAIARNE